MKLFWICAALAFFLDRIVKQYVIGHFVLHEGHDVLEGILSFVYVQNQGAAFSMLSGQRWLLLLIAAAAVGAILWYRRGGRLGRWMDSLLGMVVGGAIGNMVDRFFYGYVVDFISIGWWPVFNVADMMIVGGGIGLLICVVWKDMGQRGEDAEDE